MHTRKSHGIVCWLALSASVLLVGCSAEIRDDWLDYRPTERDDSQWSEIAVGRIYEVPAEKTSEGLALLEYQSWQKLNAARARSLAGPQLPPPAPGHEYYLLRTVCGLSTTKRLEVLSDGRSITMLCGVLARTSRVQRLPLVVELPAAPEHVFVEAYIAT